MYRTLLDPLAGTILELGCGAGRPLLRWLEAGYEIEGIDASADMLAKLRAHAAARGLSPTVHHGDIAPLDLGRRFAAIVCPAGTFMLLDDVERAQSALASYLRHLGAGRDAGADAERPFPRSPGRDDVGGAADGHRRGRPNDRG